jgi:hypothetical protein
VRIPEVAAILGAIGLAPGPAGWDEAALVAAVEGRGWGWSVEPAAGRHGGAPLFRALVFDPAPRHEEAGRVLTAPHGRGRGATEADALALALARMLAQGGAGACGGRGTGGSSGGEGA